MGKISQWQSRQLASSAVGVPSQDRSGEIIAQGLQQGVQGIASVLGERKALADDLAADVHIAEYSMAYGEAKGKAMTLYRDKPEALPKAVHDHGQKLIEDFSSKMEPGVAENFRRKASAFITNDTSNSLSWARQRDQEIIVGNIQKGFNNLELASQNAKDPTTLKNVLTAIDNHAVKAQNFIDFNSANTLKDRTTKAAKDNAIQGLISVSSKQAVQALESGEYLKNGALTPSENSAYLRVAKTAAITDASIEQYRSIYSSGAQLSDMATRLGEGTLSISEINLQLEWAKLHENDTDINGEKVIPDGHITGLESLRDIALKQDYRPAAQKASDSLVARKEWETHWTKILMDKPAKGAKGYNDVIGTYAKALKAYQNGVLSDKDFATAKKILDTKLRASAKGKPQASLGEALENAATKRLNFWEAWDKQESIYDQGYRLIGEKFKNRTDLSAADRQRQVEDLLVKYTEHVDNMTEEQRNSIQNTEKAAKDILEGTEKDGKISQGLFDRLMVIKTADGAIYQRGQIIQRNGGAFLVDLDKTTGKPIFRRVKVK
jgi:hypothetical protein